MGWDTKKNTKNTKKLKQYNKNTSANQKTGTNSAQPRDIEVILDVVYNHTAVGNHFGPVFNFKGADNLAYNKTVEGDERLAHFLLFCFLFVFFSLGITTTRDVATR